MDHQDGKASVTFWKRCSTCKKEIPFGGQYYLCSVSTCRHPRTGLRFCSAPCWDGHLGFARHRESWAEEAVAPSKAEYLAEAAKGTGAEVARAARPKTFGDTSVGTKAVATPSVEKLQFDTLVVVSKVKDLIRRKSAFNTSQCCIDALSKKVTAECQKGIVNAKASGRSTVLGRDLK